jgi:hypothetical protein
VLHPRAELYEGQQLAGALVDLFARPAAEMQRKSDVLEARQRREKIEELKDEADLVATDPREPIVGEAASASPSTRTRPAVGRSRPPTRFSSVDLPEPDGPMMDTICARGMTRLTSSSAVTWRLP